ncbi:glycosyl transferase family 2, partial [Photobacterium kishitanii]
MLFSVVMCVHEMNPFLDDAITSILEQKYAHDFEVIIIANNCTDDLYK